MSTENSKKLSEMSLDELKSLETQLLEEVNSVAKSKHEIDFKLKICQAKLSDTQKEIFNITENPKNKALADRQSWSKMMELKNQRISAEFEQSKKLKAAGYSEKDLKTMSTSEKAAAYKKTVDEEALLADSKQKKTSKKTIHDPELGGVE